MKLRVTALYGHIEYMTTDPEDETNGNSSTDGDWVLDIGDWGEGACEC